MILKTIIVTVILVAIVMLALGIKLLFDKNAKFEVHSCSFVNEEYQKHGTQSNHKIAVKKLSANDLFERKRNNKSTT